MLNSPFSLTISGGYPPVACMHAMLIENRPLRCSAGVLTFAELDLTLLGCQSTTNSPAKARRVYRSSRRASSNKVYALMITRAQPVQLLGDVRGVCHEACWLKDRPLCRSNLAQWRCYAELAHVGLHTADVIVGQ